MDKSELIRLAFEAREHSYAPYSGFKVGAALLASDGKIFLGSNVENASYGGSICAERAAALRAVYEGSLKFSAIAIVGFADGGEVNYCYPCGICRQFLREFALPGMRVYTARSADDIFESDLDSLLPHSFGPESLL